MRVLHVLHHTLPIADGYSFRTNAILTGQAAAGVAVAAVTSAQQSVDTPNPTDVIDGVATHRTPPYRGGSLPLWRERGLMALLERRVEAAAADFRPDVIHAHSPVLVGHPAQRVAARRRVPFVYEIRDLWENASVDRGRFSARSIWYPLARSFETSLIRRSDATVAICDSLKTDIASRLSATDRLFVVPNGVDTERFAPAAPSATLRAKWRLDGKQVVAYVGTFQPYEGLDLLLASLPALVAACPDVHLLLVGGGEREAEVRTQAAASGAQGHLTLTGRLPQEEVSGVYALADVLVYPRHLTRTTALTTPLKPLEAMAMERAVLVSDVPAMRELVVPGTTGMTFRAGDPRDFVRACAELLRDRDLRRRLGTAARQDMLRTRQWPQNIRRYLEIYHSLVEEH